MNSLVLVCAGGLAAEVAAMLQGSADHKVIGVLDDNRSPDEGDVAGLPVLGGIEDAADVPDAMFVLCAGAGTTRASVIDRMSERIGCDRFATLVSPDVRIPSGCRVGEGSIILAGSVLTADVTVGRHVVLMPRTVCTHGTRIGDFATLCAGVSLGGCVTIGEHAYLGMNSSVRQRLRVGSHSTLGMGSVLLKDLPAGEIWVGNPATKLQRRAA